MSSNIILFNLFALCMHKSNWQVLKKPKKAEKKKRNIKKDMNWWTAEMHVFAWVSSNIWACVSLYSFYHSFPVPVVMLHSSFSVHWANHSPQGRWLSSNVVGLHLNRVERPPWTKSRSSRLHAPISQSLTLHFSSSTHLYICTHMYMYTYFTFTLLLFLIHCSTISSLFTTS